MPNIIDSLLENHNPEFISEGLMDSLKTKLSVLGKRLQSGGHDVSKLKTIASKLSSKYKGQMQSAVKSKDKAKAKSIMKQIKNDARGMITSSQAVHEDTLQEAGGGDAVALAFVIAFMIFMTKGLFAFASSVGL
jgi:hypothetical protein